MIPCPIQQNARRFPDEPAIYSAEETISWKALDARVGQMTLLLRRQGVEPGQRVAVLGPVNKHLVMILAAVWRLKAVACLFNTRLPKAVLQDQIRVLSCQRMVHSSFPLLEEDPPVDKETRDWLLDPRQWATIMFTSGSTAQPKAAVHTWGNHYYSALGSNERLSFQPGRDCWLLSLPVFHVGGLSLLFRSFLSAGALMIPSASRTLSDVLRKEKKVTHVSFVSTQLYRLLRDDIDLSGLKVILLGGGAPPPALLREAGRRHWPVYRTYGLTEMSSQVATAAPQDRRARILPYREVRLSADGEVWVRGATLFQGYLRDEGLDRSVFDPDGWFPTGDLGQMEEDLLVIHGRKDAMFISGGENIQPEEIERHLLDLEGVRQALVIPVEDEEFGFRPVAFVRTDRRIPLMCLENHLRSRLPGYKCPEAFYVWPDNLTGAGLKPSRRDVQAYLKANKALDWPGA